MGNSIVGAAIQAHDNRVAAFEEQSRAIGQIGSSAVNDRLNSTINQQLSNTVILPNATTTSEQKVTRSRQQGATDLNEQQNSQEILDFLRDNPIPELDLSVNLGDNLSLGFQSQQLNGVGFNQLDGVRSGLLAPYIFNVSRSLDPTLGDIFGDSAFDGDVFVGTRTNTISQEFAAQVLNEVGNFNNELSLFDRAFGADFEFFDGPQVGPRDLQAEALQRNRELATEEFFLADEIFKLN